MHLQYVREKFSQHTAPPPTPSISLYITLYVFDDGGHEPAIPTHYALKFSKRAREKERERETYTCETKHRYRCTLLKGLMDIVN